jgi:hypothetical protein
MMKTLSTLAAALLVAGAPAFAQHARGGGGGGGFSGGHAGYSGGGHAGGGGHAFSGGGHAFAGGGARGFAGHSNNFGVPHAYTAPHASFSAGHVGGHMAYAPRAGVAAPAAHSYTGGQHFAPRAGFSTAFHGAAGTRAGIAHSWQGAHAGVAGHPGWTGQSGWTGHSGWAGHSGWTGHSGWRGGTWHGGNRYWAGGVWRGTYWPRVYYGWGFPLFLPVLPALYATYWWGGVPYYYVNDVYYTYDQGQNGYVVTEPPPVAGEDADNSGTDNSQAATGSSDVYAYPENGQSEEQQSNDRYECHNWARSQTNYDPTHPSDSQGNPDDYHRAMVACLTGKGYSAK